MKLQGITGVKGFAQGPAIIWRRPEIEVSSLVQKARNIDREMEQIDRSLAQAGKELQKIIDDLEKEGRTEESRIIRFQQMLLIDVEIIGALKNLIKNEGVTAQAAFVRVIEQEISNLLLDESDPNREGEDYFAGRTLDYKDLVSRVLRILQEQETLDPFPHKECVMIADDLHPSEIVQLEKGKVLALALGKGTPTSHSVIIASERGIPTVIGLGNKIELIQEGDLLLVDGDQGVVIVNPESDELKAFRNRLQQATEEYHTFEEIQDLPSVTLDGCSVNLEINIGRPEEIEESILDHIDGIGLWRTEFLFLDREREPEEEEQLSIYKGVSEKLSGKPINIRTLDAGGDKNLPYLCLPHEPNPSLGMRGIRLSLKHVDLFKRQLRAIIRANVSNNLRVMLPLVSLVEEIETARGILDQCQKELGNEFKGSLPMGIMVEVPSTAMSLDIFMPLVDFVSVGTNDLTQYMLASDRQNEALFSSYSPFYPPLIRLLKQIAQIGQKENKSLSICGEMASNSYAIPLLIGLGFRKLSVSPGRFIGAKYLIRHLRLSECQQVAGQVLRMSRRVEIEHTLATFIEKSRSLKNH
jgi:phosphoenolpyruvate-protein phosphotransferase (PTS system enzyme I)